MLRKTLAASGFAALILGVGFALVPRGSLRSTGPGIARPLRLNTGIGTTALDARRIEPSYSKTGDIVTRPLDPALADALSPDSRLSLSLRLQALRALTGNKLTTAQSAAMRAFVADPRVPADLGLAEFRALKNDVLNVLCFVPGEEVATAAVLRALYADTSADLGMRDYALQHLATLAEREPDLGWSSHWAALEGSEPGLAATALIHLASRQRAGDLVEPDRRRVEAAALRLAANEAAKEPARATAIQLCGRLHLVAARDLAVTLARSERASIPLRIAAIAALGDLGDGVPAIREYLRETASGPEIRLRVPAASALSRPSGL